MHLCGKQQVGFINELTVDQQTSRLVNTSFSYVQGMNVIAAPFLYVMPELDAYYTFSTFIQLSCPMYVQPALEGVHCGVRLLDICLNALEPRLYNHLKSKGLSATVYAFPCKFKVLRLVKLFSCINIFCLYTSIRSSIGFVGFFLRIWSPH